MNLSLNPSRHPGSHWIFLLGSLGVALCLVVFRPTDVAAQAETPPAAETPPPSSGVSDVGAKYPEVGDAIVRFRNGDFQGAQQLLDVAQKNHPELPPSGVMLAQLFFAGNRNASARASLENVVKTNPSDPEPYVLFGDLAIRERRITDAEQLYAAANRLCGQFTGNAQRKKQLQIRALSGLAGVAEARGDWVGAERQLRQLVKLAPDNVNGQTRLARALFKQSGKERDAYQLLRDLFEKDHTITRPEITMAVWYYQDKKQPEIQSQLIKRAIERAPEDLKTRLAAAQWALDSGDPANLSLAKANAEKAVQLNKDSVQAQLLLGLVDRFEKDYPAAEAAFQRAHLLSPMDFRAINNLALSLVQQMDDQKRRRALEYAQINVRANSDLNQQNGREAAVTLSWVLFKLGREAEAEMALQKLTQMRAAVTAESAYFAAKVFQARGKPQAALQILRPALQQPSVFPERSDAEDLLARLQAQLGTPSP